jgi:hypothetical protein
MMRSPDSLTNRFRDKASYQPSPEEQEKAARLIQKLTPPESEYHQYRALADYFLSTVGPIIPRVEQQPLRGLKLRRSDLFEGLEYMVAYVDDNWLHQVAPGCDAAASAMLKPLEADLFFSQLPPFVFLPESKRRARNDIFRSIVEHEIIHINQVIKGTFPRPPAKRRTDDLISVFLSEISAEYEASFIQNVHWPTTYHLQGGLSLEHWCLLCGYSQALEHTILMAADLDFSPRVTKSFLEKLSSSLSPLLQGIGATEEIAAWFPPLFNKHLAIAVEHVLSAFPDVAEHPAFCAAHLWVLF